MYFINTLNSTNYIFTSNSAVWIDLNSLETKQMWVAEFLNIGCSISAKITRVFIHPNMSYRIMCGMDMYNVKFE